jgi:hypothetical protein
LNKLLKLDGAEKFEVHNVITCNTIFGSKMIQDKYSDKMVLIEGCTKDDLGLAAQYGFKKVITGLELMSLYPNMCTMTMLDFFGSIDKLNKTKEGLLTRHNMNESEFKAKLQIQAVIMFCMTTKSWSFM